MTMEILSLRIGLELISSPCTFNHQSIHHPPDKFGFVVVFMSQLYNRLFGNPEKYLEVLPCWCWGVG